MRAARRFLAAGPEKHGRSETRVPQIACGTPNLGRRPAKTRPIWNLSRPGSVRHADSLAPDRKITAHPRARSPSLRAARRSWRPGAQKPGTMAVRRRRQATGARTRKKHLRNRHPSLVLEVEIVAVPPPARGRRPAALRPTVEPACRTQPGRSGLQICRAFAARCQRIGVTQAIRAIQVPDRPRFCGPAAKIRRAARNLGDPGFGSAVFLRSGGQESACRTQSGRPGSRICRVFTVRRPRIDVPRAIRAIRVSDLPRLCGPAPKNRRVPHAIRATRV